MCCDEIERNCAQKKNLSNFHAYQYRMPLFYPHALYPNEFRTFTIYLFLKMREFFFEFFFFFFEPNGAKGKLPSSILIALYTTIHFIFLYAYIYGNRSRIFINGSLFQVSKKLCLIVNLVFILLGPTASSIHRQEQGKEMRYKCIHVFLILCVP